MDIKILQGLFKVCANNGGIILMKFIAPTAGVDLPLAA